MPAIEINDKYSIVDTLEGFGRVNSPQSLTHQRRIVEGARLWRDAIQGSVDPFFLQQAMRPTSASAWRVLCGEYPALFNEAMSTSDFTALTTDILNRELLGYYTAVPIPNLGLVKKTTLRDFRYRKLFIEDGMATPYDKLGEHEVYEQRSLKEVSPILYQPDVYAAGAKMTWRALMNDDLGIFNQIPQRLAMGGARTLHKFISSFLVDVNGPSATLFNSTFANLITPTYGALNTNPALSFAGLSDAMTVIMRQVDSGGDPIMIPGRMTLVVGPGLWATAKNLLNMLTTDVSILGGNQAGATGFPSAAVRVNNWIVGNMDLVEDPYMRTIATSATGTIKDTMWMLFADPAQQNRPAIELGYLNGFDSPQLFQKAPNTMRVGGGVDPMMGDFYTMATELKSVLAFGGTVVDGRSAVASTGAGV